MKRTPTIMSRLLAALSIIYGINGGVRPAYAELACESNWQDLGEALRSMGPGADELEGAEEIANLAICQIQISKDGSNPISVALKLDKRTSEENELGTKEKCEGFCRSGDPLARQMRLSEFLFDTNLHLKGELEKACAKSEVLEGLCLQAMKAGGKAAEESDDEEEKRAKKIRKSGPPPGMYN